MSDAPCDHSQPNPPGRRRRRLADLAAAALLAGCGHTLGAAPEPPLFDAHLHYTGVDAAALPPEEIIAIFDASGITRAVVSGMPTSAVERLYAAAPERIIPFLNVYNAPGAKRNWMHDERLPARVAELLDAAGGIYRGIGELHIFADDAQSPVLMALADMAAERGLMLQIHGDAEVLDAVFERQPRLTVLWAHLGTNPRPEVIAPVLARHPNLYADTSVRDGRFVDAQGRLRAEWQAFFTEHADRVLVGVDTFWTRRWKRFDQVAAEIRGWLGQLPPDVAEQLARDNAERLFNRSMQRPEPGSSGGPSALVDQPSKLQP
jgi:hypothetical protein